MRERSLAELRRRHVELGRPLSAALEAELRADGRAGARAILAAVERRRRANRAEGQRLRVLSRYERALWDDGITLIAGVDEAGMSPIAGPVSAAAVILRVGWRHPGVNDSKQVDAKLRGELAQVIRRECVAFCVAYAEPEEIDAINIYHAGLLAMQRAVEGLSPAPEHLLIDARRIKAVPLPQSKVVHGDALCISIAAASILAKTARDARMLEYDRLYPGYGFARHKGYPVKEHFAALDRLGACPIHRCSFDPVRRVLGRSSNSAVAAVTTSVTAAKNE